MGEALEGFRESTPGSPQQQKGKQESGTCQDEIEGEGGEGSHSPDPKPMARPADPLLLNTPSSFPGDEKQGMREKSPVNER